MKPGDLFKINVTVMAWQSPTPSAHAMRTRLDEGDIITFLNVTENANYCRSLSKFGVCYVYEGYYAEFFEKLLP